MQKYFITGVCGTVGRELVKQLFEEDQSTEVVGIDINETEIHYLNSEFSDFNFRAYCCDIRDLDELKQRSQGSHIFFHTAALKHVPICEVAPQQALKTNVIGTQNCIEAARANDFSRFIFTSSDKAVNPTNVMGTTKLLGERLVTAAASNAGTDCIYSSTRFGNVLGSRGSVIPIFKDQISKGQPITVTHPDMTRFIMSLSGAVRLVIESSKIANSGDVMVTKMPVVNIKVLAETLLEHYEGSLDEIVYTGIQPGEKLYEELNNSEEIDRTLDEGAFLRIKSALQSKRSVSSTKLPYNSDNIAGINHAELKNLLLDWAILQVQPCSYD
jgi:FlaA1/EpsC-like NDP-sugar epimerase